MHIEGLLLLGLCSCVGAFNDSWHDIAVHVKETYVVSNPNYRVSSVHT